MISHTNAERSSTTRPARPWQPTACLKVEAVRCARWVVGPEQKPRQASLHTSQRFSACHAFCPSLPIVFHLLRFALQGSRSALAQPTVLARSCPAFFFCGGTAEAGQALLFVRAFTSQAPPHPRTPARARERHSNMVSVEVLLEIRNDGQVSRC